MVGTIVQLCEPSPDGVFYDEVTFQEKTIEVNGATVDLDDYKVIVRNIENIQQVADTNDSF